MKKEKIKKVCLAVGGFVIGVAAMSLYRSFIERHIPYSYRGNIIDNVFYLSGRDTLDMLCNETRTEYIAALIKELQRR